MRYLSRRRILYGVGILLAVALLYFGGKRALYHQFFGEVHRRVETSEKVVALTFDDGPDEVGTPKILDLLDQYGVKATFFVLGRRVERHPELVKDIHARGHEIGNHSYSHAGLVFRSRSFVRSEVEQTETLLKDLGVDQDRFLFRSPFGMQFYMLPSVLAEQNRPNILFDVIPKDYETQDVERMTRRVLDTTRPGSIILFHDHKVPGNVETLKRILPALQERGYRFVTVSELLTYEGKESGDRSQETE